MGSGSENRMKSGLEERESGRSGRQWKAGATSTCASPAAASLLAKFIRWRAGGRWGQHHAYA